MVNESRVYAFDPQDTQLIREAHAAAEQRGYSVTVRERLAVTHLRVRGPNPQKLDELMATFEGKAAAHD